MQDHVSEISRVIQLAVAPVFLLTALATLIGSLNMRLGRIVDIVFLFALTTLLLAAGYIIFFLL